MLVFKRTQPRCPRTAASRVMEKSDCCAFSELHLRSRIWRCFWECSIESAGRPILRNLRPEVWSHTIQRSQISRSKNAPGLTCSQNLVWPIFLMQVASYYFSRPAFRVLSADNKAAPRVPGRLSALTGDRRTSVSPRSRCTRAFRRCLQRPLL